MAKIKSGSDKPASAKAQSRRTATSQGKAAQPAMPAAATRQPAQTIVYVHGIGNKPTASVLKCQWDSALFGRQLGDRSRMAYWVNREHYPEPEQATCKNIDTVPVDDDEASTRAIMALSGDDKVQREINLLAPDDAQKAVLASIAAKMQAATVDEIALAADLTAKAAALRTGLRRGSYDAALAEREIQDLQYAYSARVLPLPERLRRLVAERLTRAFLRDVNDYLYSQHRRELMLQSLFERLRADRGPFVVIGHSQGSMIAYDVLRQMTKSDCDVRLFVTIGSPLGMQEVQDAFQNWEGQKMQVPACVDRWLNVADRLDPVAIDNDISNDVQPRGSVAVENVAQWGLNLDSPRHPHSGTGYLGTTYVQQAVREAVGSGFAEPVGSGIIARDLSDGLEDGWRDTPHRVLIQLSDESWSIGRHAELAETRDALVAHIRTMAGERDPRIDPLRHFVAADLTRHEIEVLRARFRELHIQRVWRNAEKKALICYSSDTVQARTANLGYRAIGRNIGWAVLDTGIAGNHPHFSLHNNVKEQWDCTLPGAPVRVAPGDPRFDLDKNGHGTHVAGIIAGHKSGVTYRAESLDFSGIAPETAIYGFKVLDDKGFGHDSYIIKALDTIAELNERASRPIIHGVNLSLGGNFDPSTYACGHTPLCQELRRLWRQGVVVCLAAGNEGWALIQGSDGLMPANLDVSIGDPANLEEVIAVGSVHRTNPHTYGISYFSSRGPTADGRRKPDLVAPGEKILSARHDYRNTNATTPTAEDLYVEMSGTSMAAPHVSGILAAYLSVRREFIGRPDEVKKILLDNCTDLNRDPYFQGSGLPNLIKMLANN